MNWKCEKSKRKYKKIVKYWNDNEKQRNEHMNQRNEKFETMTRQKETTKRECKTLTQKYEKNYNINIIETHSWIKDHLYYRNKYSTILYKNITEIETDQNRN